MAEESKLAKLARLYELRAQLNRTKYQNISKDAIGKVVSKIDGQIATLNKRAAKAYNKSEHNKEVTEEYKSNLANMNQNYDIAIDYINKRIAELDSRKLEVMTTINTNKKLMSKFDKAAGKIEVDMSLSPEERIAEAKKQLDEQSQKIETIKKEREEAKQLLEKAKKEQERLRQQRTQLREDRKVQLDELTESKENKMEKQSPFSKFVALFGRGASARAEALANSISERNQRAADAQKELNEKFATNREAISATQDEIKQQVQDFIQRGKDATIDFAEKTVQNGRDVRDYIANTYAYVMSSGKLGMQNMVKSVLDRVQNFADDRESTQGQKEAAKQKMQEIADRHSKKGEATQEIS